MPREAVLLSKLLNALSTTANSVDIEAEILGRLLYKNKNAHRRGIYFKKLQEVRKYNRNVRLKCFSLAEAVRRFQWSRQDSDADASAFSNLITELHETGELTEKTLSVLMKCSGVLMDVIRRGYFVPLMAATLGICSRFYVLRLHVLVRAAELFAFLCPTQKPQWLNSEYIINLIRKKRITSTIFAATDAEMKTQEHVDIGEVIARAESDDPPLSFGRRKYLLCGKFTSKHEADSTSHQTQSPTSQSSTILLPPLHSTTPLSLLSTPSLSTTSHSSTSHSTASHSTTSHSTTSHSTTSLFTTSTSATLSSLLSSTSSSALPTSSHASGLPRNAEQSNSSVLLDGSTQSSTVMSTTQDTDPNTTNSSSLSSTTPGQHASGQHTSQIKQRTKGINSSHNHRSQRRTNDQSSLKTSIPNRSGESLTGKGFAKEAVVTSRKQRTKIRGGNCTFSAERNTAPKDEQNSNPSKRGTAGHKMLGTKTASKPNKKAKPKKKRRKRKQQSGASEIADIFAGTKSKKRKRRKTSKTSAKSVSANSDSAQNQPTKAFVSDTYTPINLTSPSNLPPVASTTVTIPGTTAPSTTTLSATSPPQNPFVQDLLPGAISKHLQTETDVSSLTEVPSSPTSLHTTPFASSHLSISAPSTSVPSTSVPSASAPSTSVPSASVPSTSIPSTTGPSMSATSASVLSASPTPSRSTTSHSTTSHSTTSHSTTSHSTTAHSTISHSTTSHCTTSHSTTSDSTTSTLPTSSHIYSLPRKTQQSSSPVLLDSSTQPSTVMSTTPETNTNSINTSSLCSPTPGQHASQNKQKTKVMDSSHKLRSQRRTNNKSSPKTSIPNRSGKSRAGKGFAKGGAATARKKPKKIHGGGGTFPVEINTKGKANVKRKAVKSQKKKTKKSTNRKRRWM